MSIAENIRFLRKQKGFTQEQLANEVGIKRPLIGSYEEGRAEPRLNTLTALAKALGVTADDLINLELYKGEKPDNRDRVRVLSISVDKEDRENIELVPQKAAAGYLNGFSDPEYIAELPKFQLPILPKNATYRAFEIHGDSMLPLTSGTIVIGKYIESITEVKNGKTYVLVTREEGVVYKRVFNYLEEKKKLYLVSDNQTYSGYEVDPINVEEIWEAIAYISIQFPNPENEGDISLEKLTGIVLNIKDDVDQLKKGLKGNDL
jgi:transcriptional regulator with XRE-family HTH domain